VLACVPTFNGRAAGSVLHRKDILRLPRLPGLVAALAVVVMCISTATAAEAAVTERVSVSSSGEQGNDNSDRPAISSDGRYVAFESLAGNLVPGDTNARWDVFVRDRVAGTTQRISVSSAGDQADGNSYRPSVSADGRVVAFISFATNLVVGDTNGKGDVFVRDRLAGTTERVSVSSAGGEANGDAYEVAVSANGLFVVFVSDATNLVAADTNGDTDVFVRDLAGNTTERVSISTAGNQGNNHSREPSISADGQVVAFRSYATNLVPGDTNGAGDVFTRDRGTDTTVRVSVSSSGDQANGQSGWQGVAISNNAQFVVFDSLASNLVAGDTNGKYDVFVRDRGAGTTERVSVSSSGTEGDNHSGWHGVSVSADGQFVAFTSSAANLVTGDTNVREDAFVHNRATGITQRVSVSSSLAQADNDSYQPSVNADGRFVGFRSAATNLVAGDTNASWDVFIRYEPPAPMTMVINSGAACTNSTEVTLTVGCAQWVDVRFRNDPGGWGSWEPCAGTKMWSLPPGDGTKRVCAQGRDASMNLSAETCDEMLLDTTPPGGLGISIDAGAECSDSHSVTLTLAATSAAQRRFHNEADAWSSWEPYAPSKAWALSPGRGVKTVGFQCRDSCGNESADAADTVRIPSFDDVGCGHSQWAYVEALVRDRITSGCSVIPPLYCPYNSITRAQMAVFIIRAMGETPYQNPTPTFTDVPATHWAYGYIEKMYLLGTTRGCSASPMRYCPDSVVTRAQMAAFLCRAAGKAWLDPGAPTFADVPASSPSYGYVERLTDPASWGGTAVTSGCSVAPPLYCPNDPVTRGQMAVFLVRAFGISL